MIVGVDVWPCCSVSRCCAWRVPLACTSSSSSSIDCGPHPACTQARTRALSHLLTCLRPLLPPQVETTNKFLLGMIGILALCTVKLGLPMMFCLYAVPYWVGVVWLDVVTYLHHHGSHDVEEKMPWYRGEEWSYLRGGLTTIDRDYGIFNKIHHDIGTHVVHHLFPQIPHYNLEAATEAAKEVGGRTQRWGCLSAYL